MLVATRCRWEEELAGSTFADARLEQRLHRLVGQMDRSLGASLPFACQDWASTKAAYRFFSNERVSEAQILSGHFASTRERVRASEGPVLVLQDTTEFTFQRESHEAFGITRVAADVKLALPHSWCSRAASHGAARIVNIRTGLHI